MTSGAAEEGREPEDPRDTEDDAAPPPASDDDAWAAIVANFGERATLDDSPTDSAPPGADPARLRSLFEPYDRPEPRRAPGTDDAEADLGKAPDAPYVPPPPPPVPSTTPDRRAAWAGVIGGPALLLLSLLLGVSLPGLVGPLLVGAFVAGFVYLVVKMPREPRDPGDDGARV